MIIQIQDIIQKYNMNITGVIHIGAHYGEEVPNYIQSGIKDIILFEPLRENFEILKRNISHFTYANIRKNQVALGNSNKTISMNLSSNGLESSSILKPKLHLELYPDITFDRTEEIEMQKLDDYNCNQIDDYLTKYNMKRVETSWWYDAGWGDALYIKMK